MLKRIGAGAAIAWSAPVLTSLRVPAFAQTVSPSCTGCEADPCGFNNFCGTAPNGGPCVCAQPDVGGCTCVQPQCGRLCESGGCPEGFVCGFVECCGGFGPVCAPLCSTSVIGQSSGQPWA